VLDQGVKTRGGRKKKRNRNGVGPFVTSAEAFSKQTEAPKRKRGTNALNRKCGRKKQILTQKWGKRRESQRGWKGGKRKTPIKKNQKNGRNAEKEG